jgi:hypothetical protein
MSRPTEGVTTAAEVWNWLQRHRRPIPPQPWAGPAFRVVDSTAGGMSYLAIIRDGQQLRVAFLPALLALKQDWRATLARLIRGARLQMRVPPYRLEETSGTYLGEHRTDAMRYGMELNRKYDALRATKAADAGMRDTIAKLFPLPDYRDPPPQVRTTCFGAPTMIDDLLAKASRRAADFVARHTEDEIRAGLIKLGWTPPPDAANKTKGD